MLGPGVSRAAARGVQRRKPLRLGGVIGITMQLTLEIEMDAAVAGETLQEVEEVPRRTT